MFSAKIMRQSIAERFADRWVRDPDTDCHCWTASLDRHGYGRLRVGDRMRGAHRVAYQMAKGPIPEGLVIDHLCRNRACVNADHLEAVTPYENSLRGARWAPKTHCVNGHALDEANTRAGRGRLACKACSRVHDARRYRRQQRKKCEAASQPSLLTG